MVRQKGLTLVELMVVVAVMAIIATVAYPLYTAQVQKSRRADAKIALEMVAAAQERFFTLNGSYADNLAALDVSAEIQGGASNEGYYDISLARPAIDQFTATADIDSGAAQSSDSDCAQFTLNQVGFKGATNANCW